jgi:hypothetical protein
MSKRFKLKLDMGPGIDDCDVGWMEVTPSGMILEVFIENDVAKMTSGTYNDFRCTTCAADVCIEDLVTPGADNCLCCKSNHGRMNPNEVRAKSEPGKTD